MRHNCKSLSHKLTVLILLVSSILLQGCNKLSSPAENSNSGNQGGNSAPSIALNGTVPAQISPSQAVNISVTTTNDNGAGVLWSLGSGDPGTLDNLTTTSATYTAPASVSTATPIAIRATSIADSAVSLQIRTTIEPNGVSGGLNGRYAFLLQGFDSNDQAIVMVGSLTADGKGNITAGSIDVNYNFAIGQNTGALLGTYTVDENQRGHISFSTTMSQVPQPVTFAYSLSTDGTRGELISLDANNFQMSGRLQKQDSAAFSLSSIEASYVFGLESNSAPPRECEIGQFSIGANTLVNGVADTAMAKNGWGGEASFSGAVLTAPDQNGRGSIHISGAPGTSGTLLTYYVVSANQLDLMEADAPTASSTLLAGVAYQQKLPVSSYNLNTTGVFALSGLDGGLTLTAPIASVGILNVVPNPQVSFDTNDGGAISGPSFVPGQSWTLDNQTGRGTLTLPNGYSNGLFDSAVVYLYNGAAGFILDATPDGRNRALMGELWPQATIAAPAGKVLSRLGDGTDISVATMDADLSVSANAISGAADVRLAGQTDLSDQSLSGGSLSGTDGTGRGTANLPGALFGLSANTNSGDTTSVYYVIDTDRFVLINTVQGKPSGIGTFEPK